MKSLENYKSKKRGWEKRRQRLREKDLVPGVLYGRDKVIHTAVPFSELRQLICSPNVYLIDLKLTEKCIKP